MHNVYTDYKTTMDKWQVFTKYQNLTYKINCQELSNFFFLWYLSKRLKLIIHTKIVYRFFVHFLSLLAKIHDVGKKSLNDKCLVDERCDFTKKFKNKYGLLIDYVDKFLLEDKQILERSQQIQILWLKFLIQF